ncbi:MAG: Ig-like domain-containing protein, partial [bacterium]
VWDTTSIPDGKYEVMLKATDKMGNPAGEEEEDTEISEPFVIDNTPPVVSDLSFRKINGGAVEITGVAEDSASIISTLEYSVDKLEWFPLFPEDRVFDTQVEKFRFKLEGLEAGRQHLLLIRTRDFVGNTGSSELRISILN